MKDSQFPIIINNNGIYIALIHLCSKRLKWHGMPRNLLSLLVWLLFGFCAYLRRYETEHQVLQEGGAGEGGRVGKREAKGKMSLPLPLSKVYFIKVSCVVNNRNTSDPFLECNPEIK